MKHLFVDVSGTEDNRDIEIKPGTTCQDVLTELDLPDDFVISVDPNQHALGLDENLYTAAKDGQKIFAYSNNVVGKKQ